MVMWTKLDDVSRQEFTAFKNEMHCIIKDLGVVIQQIKERQESLEKRIKPIDH